MKGTKQTGGKKKASKKSSKKSKKASKKAENVVPPPQTEVQKMRTAQEATKKRETRKAKERSNIAGLGRRLSPSDETKNIDYGDPRRGGAPSRPRRGGGGRNKGGLVTKKSK